jgi:hypothetical protein
LQAKRPGPLSIRPREHGQTATWKDEGIDDMDIVLEMHHRRGFRRRWMQGSLQGAIDLSCIHLAQGLIEAFDEHDCRVVNTVQREITPRDLLMITAGVPESSENDHHLLLIETSKCNLPALKSDHRLCNSSRRQYNIVYCGILAARCSAAPCAATERDQKIRRTKLGF